MTGFNLNFIMEVLYPRTLLCSGEEMFRNVASGHTLRLLPQHNVRHAPPSPGYYWVKANALRGYVGSLNAVPDLGDFHSKDTEININVYEINDENKAISHLVGNFSGSTSYVCLKFFTGPSANTILDITYKQGQWISTGRQERKSRNDQFCCFNLKLSRKLTLIDDFPVLFTVEDQLGLLKK
jgi:hypothetical protein